MQGPELARGAIPASMLSVSNEIIPAFEPLKVDAELAARGRELFSRLGCAKCHTDLNVPAPSGPAPAPALAKLDAARGCLGGAAGA
jgi:hypothetical protein